MDLKRRHDIRRAFDEIEAATGLKDQAATKALLCALVKHWKLHKQLTVPFELADGAAVASLGSLCYSAASANTGEYGCKKSRFLNPARPS